jgi:hypothetical protein
MKCPGCEGLGTRATLAKEVEQMLIEHFSAYWETHPSSSVQRQKVIRLIQARVSSTPDDVLQDILNPRVPPLKTAGILDKIVDTVYGGNSDFFLRLLVKKKPRNA